LAGFIGTQLETVVLKFFIFRPGNKLSLFAKAVTALLLIVDSGYATTAMAHGDSSGRCAMPSRLPATPVMENFSVLTFFYH